MSSSSRQPRHDGPGDETPEAAPPAVATLVDLLRRQADRYEDKVACSFSYNGDGEDKVELTYRQLDTAARAIAATLQRQGAAGRRVLVFCRPGLEGVAGFFGCLYAGAVAVPVHQRLAPRLTSVVPDVRADFALAAAKTQANIKDAVDLLAGEHPLRWLTAGEVGGDAEDWVPPGIDAGATAMIQYTSGSTTAPNGVVLSHHNLLHNLAAMHQIWPGDDREIALYWLPQHHDMGLIGAIIEMVYIGCTTILMSPTAFIQRPMRWLEAMSRNHGTLSAAPNFAYALCVERSTPAERAALDLSNWSNAMCGSEPVQAATLRAFADAFAPAGFRPEAFHPVYGLAEATLLVSGGSKSPVPVVHHIDRGALGEDRVVDAAPDGPGTVAVVGCGPPQGGQRVVIVDPETHRLRGADRVGEIWIAGPSVAQGYWGKPAETERTFAAFLAETAEGPFLRTGDLGFGRDGELFVTGRVKDLIVLDGANHYPNDIEITVQDCHPALLSGRGAVFAVTPQAGGAEQLVVAQEVGLPRVGETELAGIVDAIQAALAEHHGIRAHSVILVEPMAIPTTSSGKIQRGLCRQRFLDRRLDTVAEWHAPLPPGDGAASSDLAAAAEAVKAALARRAGGSDRA